MGRVETGMGQVEPSMDWVTYISFSGTSSIAMKMGEIFPTERLYIEPLIYQQLFLSDEILIQYSSE